MKVFSAHIGFEERIYEGTIKNIDGKVVLDIPNEELLWIIQNSCRYTPDIGPK